MRNPQTNRGIYCKSPIAETSRISLESRKGMNYFSFWNSILSLSEIANPNVWESNLIYKLGILSWISSWLHICTYPFYSELSFLKKLSTSDVLSQFALDQNQLTITFLMSSEKTDNNSIGKLIYVPKMIESDLTFSMKSQSMKHVVTFGPLDFSIFP